MAFCSLKRFRTNQEKIEVALYRQSLLSRLAAQSRGCLASSGSRFGHRTMRFYQQSHPLLRQLFDLPKLLVPHWGELDLTRAQGQLRHRGRFLLCQAEWLKRAEFGCGGSGGRFWLSLGLTETLTRSFVRVSVTSRCADRTIGIATICCDVSRPDWLPKLSKAAQLEGGAAHVGGGTASACAKQLL